MKNYAVIEVVESLKMNAGEVLSNENLAKEEMAQTPMNESTRDNDPIFDTLPEAVEELKKHKSSGRVDMVEVGKHRYWECAITTYQVIEVYLNDDNEIMDWGDVWEITPFKISIDKYGHVKAVFGW